MDKLKGKNDVQNNDMAVHILKTLLASYIITGGLLLMLSLLLYKFALTEGIVSIIIIAIYVISAFAAGNMAGRKLKSRRFIWGLIMGCLYFLVLVVVSLLVNHSLKDVTTNFFTVLALCMAGGMLGGMFTNLK